MQSFTSQQQAADEIFVRNDGNERKFRLVTQSTAEPLKPFREIDLTGAVVEFALGAVDQSPTGGTFSGSSNGVTTGLTSLAYNVSAATLQTALNTNADVTSGGATVTVLKEGTAYVITWSAVGVRNLIAWDGSLLSPECTCTGTRVTTGSASAIEVQVLRVIQRPYAYVAPTTAYPVAARTITQIQTGTSTLPAIQRILLDPDPYDGTFVITGGKPQIVRAIAKANTGSVYEVSTITTTADSSGNKHNTVAALLYDAAGPVQILLTNGGTITTAIPAGGRRISVTFANNDTANTIASAIQSAVDADSQFVATVNTNQVTITDAVYGTRTVIAAGTSSFTVARIAVGAFGDLHDKYFTIYDATNSTCGVYLTQTGSAPASGHAVLSLTRYLSVTVTAGATATTIGTSIASAVDADADWVSISTTGTVTITAAANGTRTAPDAGTSTFSVSSTSTGVLVSATVPHDATADEFQELIGDQFEVEKTASHQWDITFVENGAQTAFAVTITGLVVPSGLIGELNLNTVSAFTAFAATTDEYITAILEGSITFPGKLPITFYRKEHSIYRDVIDFSTLVPTPTGVVPIIMGGTGATTAAAALVNLFASGITFAGHWRVKADGTPQFWNADQNKFHTITVTGLAGLENISISAGEV